MCIHCSSHNFLFRQQDLKEMLFLFCIQHSKFKRRLHLKRKDWTDIFPLLHINDCILLPLLQSMRVPPLLEAWSARPSSSESLGTCIFPYEHQATTFLPLLAALDRSSFLFKHKVRSFPILKAICAPTSFWSLAVRFFPLLQQLGQQVAHGQHLGQPLH